MTPPIGVALSRWSQACWMWLHGLESIPGELIEVLPFVLPCSLCSVHMKQFIREHPVSEPTCVWIVDLHNDINRRSAKRHVTHLESQSIHRTNDTRMSFVQFLFAVSFTIPSSQVPYFRTFCTLAFPTVGLEPPDPVQIPEHHLASHIFGYMRPFSYDSFNELVVDFVPPSMYSVYGLTDLTAPVYTPTSCTRSMVDTAIQSIVHEERVDRMYVRRDALSTTHRIADRINGMGLVRRIHHFCPTFEVPLMTDLDTNDIDVQTSLRTDVSSGHIAQMISTKCLSSSIDSGSTSQYPTVLCVALVLFGACLVACVRYPHHRATMLLMLLLLSIDVYMSIVSPGTGVPFTITSMITILLIYRTYHHRCLRSLLLGAGA
jgi:hypothetical protein